MWRRTMASGTVASRSVPARTGGTARNCGTVTATRRVRPSPTADVSVRIDDGDAVGIDPGASYAVRELLGGVDLGSKDGAAILSGGVKVKVPAWSSAVVGLTPG